VLASSSYNLYNSLPLTHLTSTRLFEYNMAYLTCRWNTEQEWVSFSVAGSRDCGRPKHASRQLWNDLLCPYWGPFQCVFVLAALITYRITWPEFKRQASVSSISEGLGKITLHNSHNDAVKLVGNCANKKPLCRVMYQSMNVKCVHWINDQYCLVMCLSNFLSEQTHFPRGVFRIALR
jgi:hypothetical protein